MKHRLISFLAIAVLLFASCSKNSEESNYTDRLNELIEIDINNDGSID